MNFSLFVDESVSEISFSYTNLKCYRWYDDRKNNENDVEEEFRDCERERKEYKNCFN